ncbi:MAG: hypothetical protein IPK80_01435 [Nannocystis sp.]|nr:hypothetical protein [Nannocystis sp.]
MDSLTCLVHLRRRHLLRDLLCLLPSWPKSRVLGLAPAYWKQTLEQQETQQRLATNIFRRLSLDGHAPAV